MLLTAHLVPAPSARQALARLRWAPAPAPGLLWSQTLLTTPLAQSGPPKLDGNGLLAAWADEAALDAFLAGDPLAERLADGWSARLEPLRAYGAIPELPGLGRPERPVDPGEPVAVLTFGRTKFHRAPAFLRNSARAERQAVADPALLLSTAMAGPPRTVATFSLWRSAEAMRAYAVGPGTAHAAAMDVNHRRPFHREQLFARFRPSGSRGAWRGAGDPLATGVAAPA
ncbi:MAG TPA: hypothetical protein VIL49_03440 [Capillimicrobium sp.]|jgi:hypothetical protein